MTMATSLSRSVLADQVKERILESILSGQYAPDSRIVETQIARELGTSQAPVPNTKHLAPDTLSL